MKHRDLNDYFNTHTFLSSCNGKKLFRWKLKIGSSMQTEFQDDTIANV